MSGNKSHESRCLRVSGDDGIYDVNGWTKIRVVNSCHRTKLQQVPANFIDREKEHISPVINGEHVVCVRVVWTASVSRDTQHSIYYIVSVAHTFSVHSERLLTDLFCKECAS